MMIDRDNRSGRRMAPAESRLGRRWRGGRAPVGGFTVVELLVVMAIIVMLSVAMVGVAGHVRKQSLIQQTQSTMQILKNALVAYKTALGATVSDEQLYPASPYGEYTADGNVGDPWAEPPLWHTDYLDYAILGMGDIYATNDSLDAILCDRHNHLSGYDDVPTVDDNDERYLEASVSIEILYAFLYDRGDSRAVLNKLPADRVTNHDHDSITIAGEQRPLMEVNDAWGHPLRYRTRGAGNVPLITSAGPDGLFDNADDLLSTEF